MNHFQNLFNVVTRPMRLISHRGTAFTTKAFEKFLSDKGITHVKIATASPWANGQAGSVNRFLKSVLCKVIDKAEDWADLLQHVQFVINNTYHKSIKSTPFKLLYGISQPRMVDRKIQEMIELLNSTDQDIEKSRSEIRDSAVAANRALQLYNKSYYDKLHKKPTKYQLNQLVMVKKLSSKPGESKKLSVKWKGPYQVLKILNKNRFVITDTPGFNKSNKSFNKILSSDKLKPWVKDIVKLNEKENGVKGLTDGVIETDEEECETEEEEV